jgi:hypothetical protein
LNSAEKAGDARDEQIMPLYQLLDLGVEAVLTPHCCQPGAY